MRPRVTHIFVLLDYAVGTFFVLALMAAGVFAYVLTGPPKRYEVQALGAAYTDALLHIEGGARELRADFCARADQDTLVRAKCERTPDG